mmetsp:Transcript_15499/g.18681  ORF Transcript_15499/g.18681 Transcript_15499/m.18681 type:complete len:285 (+) Transcript_15499:57-911(+)
MPSKRRKRNFSSNSKNEGWKRKKSSKWGQRPGSGVTPGPPMVLVTCEDCKEKRAAEEVINWLTSFAEEMVGRSTDAAINNEEEDTKDLSNVADDLEAELQALRDEKETKTRKIGSEVGGAKNGESNSGNMFVKDKMDGKSMCLLRCLDKRIKVSELVTRVMKDALATGKQHTRFTHRVLPMSHTCFSKMEELKPILDEAITEFFSPASINDEQQHHNKDRDDDDDDEKEKTFAVVIKNRGAKNKHMDRMDIINYIVPKMPEGYTVNLDNPRVTVMVQIIGRVTG